MHYDAEANEMRFDPLPAQTAAQKLDFMLSAFVRETGYDLRPFIEAANSAAAAAKDARIAELEAERKAVIAALRNYELNGANAAAQIRGIYSDLDATSLDLREARKQLAEVTRERDALIPLAYETRPGMQLPPVTWQQCEQAALRKLHATETDRERLRAAAELGRQELDALWSFHGQNLQVYGWHLNGAAEPFDSFFDDNNKGALEALTAALAPALATEGESTQSKLDKAINALRIARDTTRGFVRPNEHDAWSFPEMDEILGPISE